jgi:hypothetical protein
VSVFIANPIHAVCDFTPGAIQTGKGAPPRRLLGDFPTCIWQATTIRPDIFDRICSHPRSDPRQLLRWAKFWTPHLKNSKTLASLRWCGKASPMRIIAAAKFGELDPARLLAAALRGSD